MPDDASLIDESQRIKARKQAEHRAPCSSGPVYSVDPATKWMWTRGVFPDATPASALSRARSKALRRRAADRCQGSGWGR